MDNEDPFLQSISKCFARGQEVYLEIKCLDEAAINKVLDMIKDQFGANFNENLYGKTT